MKVYKIEVDLHEPDPYQWLFATNDDQTGWELDQDAFTGTSMASIWRPTTVYAEHPKDREGDFYHYAIGAFIINERARIKAATPLEMSGEFLPVTFEGREKEDFYVYNIKECINVLDRKASKFGELSDKGHAWDISEYVFVPDRFGESTIFKIPDEELDIFVLERTGDPEDEEFKALVEAHDLKGLIFEEVWSDEKMPRKTAKPKTSNIPSANKKMAARPLPKSQRAKRAKKR